MDAIQSHVLHKFYYRLCEQVTCESVVTQLVSRFIITIPDAERIQKGETNRDKMMR